MPVALRLVEYRAEHGLSQSALARKLQMQQPAIARLEAGDHNPEHGDVRRCRHAQGLEIDFHIDIIQHVEVQLTRRSARSDSGMVLQNAASPSSEKM